MKLNWIIGGALALSIVSCSEDKGKEESGKQAVTASTFKTEMDSVSYALGLNIADNFVKQKIKGLNGKQLEKGFNDFVKGATTLNANQSIEVLQGFMMKHQGAMQVDTNGVVYEASLMDSVSYALGVNVSQTTKQQGVEGLESALLAAGFSDAVSGSSKMSEEGAINVLQSFGQKQQALLAEKSKLEFASVIKEGEDFLAENGKRPEITTLPSGLQYEVIKEGKGEVPTIQSKVLAHYHGTLIDGTVFDSSIERGEPAEFPVSQVIRGWTEALQIMPVGSKWKLYIPQELAYGPQAKGAVIKPYSALVFDIELLEIVK
jgi:FKBP-type peptidyl-prolyl cis-trans isomerase FklB